MQSIFIQNQVIRYYFWLERYNEAMLWEIDLSMDVIIKIMEKSELY